MRAGGGGVGGLVGGVVWVGGAVGGGVLGEGVVWGYVTGGVVWSLMMVHFVSLDVIDRVIVWKFMSTSSSVSIFWSVGARAFWVADLTGENRPSLSTFFMQSCFFDHGDIHRPTKEVPLHQLN